MSRTFDSPFLNRFQRELSQDWPEFVVIAVLSGISDAILRIVINIATVDVISGGVSLRHMVMFISMTTIHVVTRYILLRRSGTAVSNIVKSYRIQICSRIAEAELTQIERINRSEIELILGRDTATLSAPSGPLFNPLTTAISLVLTLGFLSLLSPATSITVTIAHIIFVTYFYGRRKKVMRALRSGAVTEAALFTKLNGLLGGFKEIKLNTRRKEELLEEHIGPISSQVMSHQNQVNWLQTQNWISVDAFHYLTIGIPLFILPSFYLLAGEGIAQVIALVIFTFGSVPEIIIAITLLAQYDVAIQSLEGLKRRLVHPEPDRSSDAYLRLKQQTTFEELQLNALGYSYRDARGLPMFSIGPLTLTIKRGELIFIVGGNGSGKTTLLRLISGLYLPSNGTLTLNGVEINQNNVEQYRSFFAAVFTDFHLFDRLYGLKQIKEDQVQNLLKEFMLDTKTLYSSNQFSTTDLSTGQRKRLALITALLEDRPITILDEVAADQDPEFRQYYYETLLPKLRSLGKTLLVVSHDNRYFHVADRIIRLDYGQISTSEEVAITALSRPTVHLDADSKTPLIESPK